jgi:hypothetical protein
MNQGKQLPKSHLGERPRELSKMKYLNKPLFTNDQGNQVYQCQYSKKLVSADKSINLGPLMANVSGTFVCHTDGIEARKLSKRNFDEMDANCNTCKNLERTKHQKRTDGQLLGSCKESRELMFHPDDWMGKECWEKR